ncbi:MAG TPA: carboxylating nicotinate-nucleotide diphosphorylase [Acidobacteriota bacterium]|nr:carboxylating nicotinate-nucleotide diphosphorylase [Acidobacteriota bacterium]
MNWDSPEMEALVDEALAEDIGPGDLTSETLIPISRSISAVFLAKESGTLAGLPLVCKIFRRLDPRCHVKELIVDGGAVKRGFEICRLKGKARALLAGERLVLNFLQRLSGIATETARYVRKAQRFGIAVLDTRKTTPMLRSLEKYAVAMGGGRNHRAGLYDAILVKDNHLKLQPDFRSILESFGARGYAADQVEVEVTTLNMLRRASGAGVRRFLLDNMAPSVIRRCVRRKQPEMYFEVSGGINSSNFSRYLIRGVDAISIGALTHSVRSLDISMEIIESD